MTLGKRSLVVSSFFLAHGDDGFVFIAHRTRNKLDHSMQTFTSVKCSNAETLMNAHENLHRNAAEDLRCSDESDFAECACALFVSESTATERDLLKISGRLS